MAYGSKIDRILYGGDYNPEQWPPEVWEEDMRMMKKAHMNVVTLNVFNWAVLQPDEHTWRFEQLDQIMEMVRENGMKVCLATSTGAHPAWMAKRHPDILRTEFNGMKRKFGGRHNSCPNSPTYRRYAPELAGRLAARYKDYDNIVAWHVSNEFGGECYCENCEKAFRQWLKRKYKTLEELNRCFYTAFWGHTFYDWDEIVLPNLLSEHFAEDRTMFQGITLDYKRFNSDSMLECFQLEYDAIRREMPDVPITTNLMGFYKHLDYQKWAGAMDLISGDSYPASTDSPAVIAMNHDLMRGIKNQDSFVLMEQTPSVTNWFPYNRLKRPGEMRLFSYQAAAHGADAIQFFQIRRSRGACEKYHGAVIDHAGRDDTRVFREIEALGKELELLGDTFLEGRTPAKTALVFDWDNWWALEYSAGPSIYLKYLEVIKDYYTAMFELNVPVDIVGVEDDLSLYQVVAAPLLYMTKSGYAEKIKQFVRQGGTFLTTCFSGIVEEHDLVLPGGYPGELKDLLGIWVEENDALGSEEENSFYYEGECYPARILCDLMHLEGAEAVSLYNDDFYRKTPVITRNAYGKGSAWYVGTCSSSRFYKKLLRSIFLEAGVSGAFPAPAGVEAAIRKNEKGETLFLLNHTNDTAKIVLNDDYQNLLNGERYRKGSSLLIKAKDVMILRR